MLTELDLYMSDALKRNIYFHKLLNLSQIDMDYPR